MNRVEKALIVAFREYRAAVRSKAFLITLVVMPVLMGGAIVGQLMLKDRVDTTDRQFAVVDRSGQLGEALLAAADAYNETAIYEEREGQRVKVKPAFKLELVDADEIGDRPQSTLQLSEKVRSKQLHGFLEIDASVLDAAAPSAGPPATYHSLNPVDNAFRRWAGGVINASIQQIRSVNEGVDVAVMQRVVQPVGVQDQGLVERNADTGEISEPEDANVMAYIFVPMGLMMLIFMSVMVGATPLMQAVMEEKQARISEVLLGSVRPFPLMMGKLIGIAAVTLTTILFYICGAFLTLNQLGHADKFPALSVVLWLVLFQTLAVLMYGSLFVAIGAAVSDMREAQSAMMPIMIFAMAPMFVWLYVVKEPDAAASVIMSMIPPATPMLMMLRIASPQGVPLWQPVLGAVLVLISTVFCVWAAGRIFRAGILLQGESASLARMAKWVLRG